ncbi:DUF4034 domain-containing protein [Planctomycetota bacterium]|nr:DUF4034 domain-containing protein [Planctomycetota bacterium]
MNIRLISYLLIASIMSLPTFAWGQSGIDRRENRPGPDGFEYGEYSYFDLQQEKLNYFKGYLVESYEKYGSKSAAWDEDAKAILSDFELYLTYLIPNKYPYTIINNCGIDFPAMRERCDRVMETTCDDPLVMMAMFRMYYKFNHRQWRHERLKWSYFWMPDMGYPDDIRYMITQLYHEYTWEQYVTIFQHKFKTTYTDEGIRFFKFLKGKPELRGIYFSHFMNWFEEDSERAFPTLCVFADKLKEVKNEVDPWMYHMFMGVHYTQRAWEERGSDWGSEVTDEGWLGFRDNLAVAYSHFIKAHKIDAEMPYAAAEMITVAMGNCDAMVDGTNDWYWFRQAIAAQHDYIPAYHAISWAMRPRWGGDHNKMFSAGLVGMLSWRFDTRAPLMLRVIVNDIAKDLESIQFAKDRIEVQDAMMEMYEGVLSSTTYASDPKHMEWYHAEYMGFCWHVGELEKAKELALKLPVVVKANASAVLDQKAVKHEMVLAYTGKYRDALLKADAMYAKQQYAAASDATDKLFKKMKMDKNVHDAELAYVKERNQFGKLMKQYMAGEWTQLIDPENPMLGWEKQYGEWEVEDGALVGTSNQAKYRQGLMLVHKFPFGTDYKIRGKAKLDSGFMADAYEAHQNIGFFFHALVEDNSKEMSIGLIPQDDVISFFQDSYDKTIQYGKTDIENEVNFEMHVNRTKVTVFLEGKQVLDITIDPPKSKKYRQFGIGSWTHISEVKVRFESLEIVKNDGK